MARAVELRLRRQGHAAAGQPGRRRPSPASGGSGCGSSASGGASGNAIVRIAESQLGNGEVPPGSNCTIYGPCEEWCSLFVAWVWERAGVPMGGGTAPYAYSGSIYEWAKAHEGGGLSGGRPAAALPGEPNGARVLPPGDAVLYGWGPTASEHVGIVERVFPGGQITTIDGNYGDRVARVGPFLPSRAVESGEPAPIFGYAQPPGVEAQTAGGVR